jgi:hypothetical protein
MTDPELAIRTIDGLIPQMSTAQIQKWKGVLSSALAKIDKELTATHLHTCKICFYQEWGYRDELPSAWYQKGEAEICFQHEYNEAEKLLKEAGFVDDAFFPPEIPSPTVGGLTVAMDNLPEKATQTEQTLEELMDLL